MTTPEEVAAYIEAFLVAFSQVGSLCLPSQMNSVPTCRSVLTVATAVIQTWNLPEVPSYYMLCALDSF